MQKFQEFLRSLLRHYRQANVSDSAAVLTYYSLLSIFPILLIAGNLISLLRLDTDWVLSYIKPVLPVPVFETVSPIIRSFLEQGSGTTLSIGILVTIWSASQMVAAFQRSINQAYGIDSTNALVSRFLSFLMILVLVILIFIISFVYGLSETVIDTVAPCFIFRLSSPNLSAACDYRFPRPDCFYWPACSIMWCQWCASNGGLSGWVR
ncbi:YihY/virulence factor BrkB family protein [Secundilactobacillus kimchicus]|uniref:YihY/virulence factor BrkB family protein n=1 Tax=Secundilactobacillus kimchicus TaxID=528209 RepID=UPI0006E26DD8|nr:YihY/virulence factor BrkB family protein [Secundilactobacillus kimchicus]